MNLYKAEDIATLKASASGSNILLKWTWMNSTVPQYVKNTLVFYLQEGYSKVNILKLCGKSNKTECVIEDVLLDTTYNICIKAVMTENWPWVREPTICTRVTNNQWEFSAFVGSTAGALLALFLIIMLVLMSKRLKKRQKNIKENMNPISQRQRYDSAFESQFDSVAIREDTSFYDDLVTSEVSYFDSSYKSSSDNCSSSVIIPSTANVCENTSVKTCKKRASLIEEESTCSQSCDGWMYTITTKHSDDTYQNIKEPKKSDTSPSRLMNENKAHVMETCIDETDTSDIPNCVNIGCRDLSPKIDLNVSSPQHENVSSSTLVMENFQKI